MNGKHPFRRGVAGRFRLRGSSRNNAQVLGVRMVTRMSRIIARVHTPGQPFRVPHRSFSGVVAPAGARRGVEGVLAAAGPGPGSRHLYKGSACRKFSHLVPPALRSAPAPGWRAATRRPAFTDGCASARPEMRGPPSPCIRSCPPPAPGRAARRLRSGSSKRCTWRLPPPRSVKNTHPARQGFPTVSIDMIATLSYTGWRGSHTNQWWFRWWCSVTRSTTGAAVPAHALAPAETESAESTGTRIRTRVAKLDVGGMLPPLYLNGEEDLVEMAGEAKVVIETPEASPHPPGGRYGRTPRTVGLTSIPRASSAGRAIAMAQGTADNARIAEALAAARSIASAHECALELCCLAQGSALAGPNGANRRRWTSWRSFRKRLTSERGKRNHPSVGGPWGIM